MLLSLLLLGAGDALAQDQDEELYMADMGITATLPEGWSVPRWSDWDLDAVDRAQTTQVHLSYTTFQVPPSKQAAQVWAGLAAENLREKDHSRVEMTSTRTGDFQGTPTAEIELTYRYEGQQKAVLLQRSFNVDGRTVHLSATALARNSERAEQALEDWWPHLEVGKAAQDLEAMEGEVASDAGFGSLLPPGWRQPLPSELTETRKIAVSAGQGKIDKDKCWVAVRPYPDGEASLLMACSYALYTGQVDEHSFEGMELTMREHFFKGVQVPAAEPVATGADQRLSFVYELPVAGDRSVRMAATPYDQGHVLTYVIGPTGDVAALDSALRAVLTSTTFSGADGGVHPVGALQWMQYMWDYRRSSPIVWGPGLLLLGLIGLVGVKMKGSKSKYEDL